MNINFYKAKIQDIFDNILERRKEDFPDYTTTDKTDFGIMILWLVSVVIKFFADFVMKQYRDNFLITSTNRKSIINNSIARGYSPRGVISQLVLLTFETTIAVTIPKGTKVKNKNNVVFETVEDVSSQTEGGNVSVYAIQGESRSDQFTGQDIPSQLVICQSYPFVEDTVEVYIDRIKWSYTDEILESEKNSQVYTYYADELGRLCVLFGNETNGKQIDEGSQIVVNYKIGLGESGTVENEEIDTIVESIAGVSSVKNTTIKNTEVTEQFLENESTLKVKSTTGFANEGVIYVGGISIDYIGITENTFENVNIPFDINPGQIVSARQNNILQSKNLETNDEIRYRALNIQGNKNIGSEIDLANAFISHPAVAWAKSYTFGSITHIVAIGITGKQLSDSVKTSIQQNIDRKKIPGIRYFVDNPEFVDIDVVIEVTRTVNSVFDSDEILVDDPILYKGVKQNVEYAINNFLSPITAGSEIISLEVRDLTKFELYQTLTQINEVENIKLLNFSKAIVEDAYLTVNTNKTVQSTVDMFEFDDIGKYIMLSASESGNNGYKKIVEFVDEKNIVVDKAFSTNESGLRFYFANNDDIVLSGNKIQRPGNIIIIDRSSNTYSKSQFQGISNAQYEFNQRLL